MAAETRRLLDGPWAGGGRRSVYADFNTLTLDITTGALFGAELPREQAADVTGARLCLMARGRPGAPHPSGRQAPARAQAAGQPERQRELLGVGFALFRVHGVPDRVQCATCCTLMVHTAGRPCV
jgi:hypothetical protein